MGVSGYSQASEPHAGYYVASQSRPPFVTDLTSREIADVFDLVERVCKLPRSSPEPPLNDKSV